MEEIKPMEKPKTEETERKPIFGNTFIWDEQSSLQLYRGISGVRRTLLLVLCAVFIAVMLFRFVNLILRSAQTGESILCEPFFWLGTAAVALYCALIVLVLSLPKRNVKRDMKRIRESYGTDRMEIHTLFFDDELVLHNLASKGEQRFAYSAFTKMTETQDLFLLWTQQKQVVTVQKSGLDGTDAAGFRTFMDEKCPNAKRKWRKA